MYQTQYTKPDLMKNHKHVPQTSYILPESFPGQYKSIMKKDYLKSPLKICPVKKFSGVHDILKNSSLYYNPIQRNYFF